MSTTCQTTMVQLPEGDPLKLRALASWYREIAEQTGNVTIWEARLLTAIDLDAKADHMERLVVGTRAPSDDVAPRGRPMSLTILYRHPGRRYEASLTMIARQGRRAAAAVNQLEKRGFVVDKITTRSARNRTETAHLSAPI